jgi:hypothetical protein
MSSFVFLKNKDLLRVAESILTDPLNGSTIIIPHSINSQGIFFNKFSKIIEKKFPIVSTNCLISKTHKLGANKFNIVRKGVNDNEMLVCTMVTAKSGKFNTIKYSSILECFIDIQKHINHIKQYKQPRNIQIHLHQEALTYNYRDNLVLLKIINEICYDTPIYFYTNS